MRIAIRIKWWQRSALLQVTCTMQITRPVGTYSKLNFNFSQEKSCEKIFLKASKCIFGYSQFEKQD